MPGLRPFVVEDQLREAAAKIAAARAALERARAQSGRRDGRLRSRGRLRGRGCEDHFFHDDFDEPNPDDWETPRPLDLPRRQAGARPRRRDPLRPPRRFSPPADFQARLRFTLTGGEPWRSAGLCFDVGRRARGARLPQRLRGRCPSCKSPTSRAAVYVYPPEAAQARPIKLGEPHELTVRVRGRLVNVAVDGKHALAYRLPVARQAGSLSLDHLRRDGRVRPLRAVGPCRPMAKLVEPGRGGDPLTRQGPGRGRCWRRRPWPPPRRSPTRSGRGPPPTGRDSASRRPPTRRTWPRGRRGSNGRPTWRKAEEDLARADLAMLDAGRRRTPRARSTTPRRPPSTPRARRSRLRARPTRRSSARSRRSNRTWRPRRRAASRSRRPAPAAASALARWLTDRSNPLTARVAVNHVWMRHFGRPLVPTVFDFGRKGTPPTHPELLDWLAVDFMEHGWSMKHLHRLIVTSQRLPAVVLERRRRPRRPGRPIPENRCYWRMNPIRMEAQVVRDSLLHLAGELDLDDGRPVDPGRTTRSSRRRSLYFFHSHNDHQKFLSTFDDASVLECYRRAESIVPAAGPGPGEQPARPDDGGEDRRPACTRGSARRRIASSSARRSRRSCGRRRRRRRAGRVRAGAGAN